RDANRLIGLHDAQPGASILAHQISRGESVFARQSGGVSWVYFGEGLALRFETRRDARGDRRDPNRLLNMLIRTALLALSVSLLSGQSPNKPASKVALSEIDDAVLNTPTLHPGLKRHLTTLKRTLDAVADLELDESQNRITHGYKNKPAKATFSCDAMDSSWRTTTVENSHRVETVEGKCYSSEGTRTTTYRFSQRIGEGFQSFQLESEDGLFVDFVGSELPRKVPNWFPPLPLDSEVEQVNASLEAFRPTPTLGSIDFIFKPGNDCLGYFRERVPVGMKIMVLGEDSIRIHNDVQGVTIKLRQRESGLLSCFLFAP
ncbi:MAG: hypothetical protein KF847_20910, partial [Pirellulales bacterium]|nr:hypothetical protein [Pirellulales bacterium]